MEEEKRRPQMEASWMEVIGDEFEKPYMRDLREFLRKEKASSAVYPPGSLIFNAFFLTPFDKVRVVILGQDPYHGARQAHGLSFSVPKGVRPPPSLQNIFQEIHQDLRLRIPSHGDLSSWAAQGVLLLNAVLTVRASQAASHANQGWEIFTDSVIHALNTRREGIAFALWGRYARDKAQSVDRNKHLILTAAHPSPYSADKGFFGCKHFSRINHYLQEQGQPPIDWSLPAEA